MDSYSYVLELVDKMSGPAKTAKQEIESLTGELESEGAALAKLTKRYEELNSAEVVDIATAKKLQAEIKGKQASVDGLSDKIRSQVAAEQEASGSTMSFGESIAGLGAIAAAAAVALLAVAAGLAALLIGGAGIALEAAHFKSNTIDALKSVTGTQEAAASTFKQIRDISDEIGISEKRAQSLGLSLLDAGVNQKDLGDAIKSIALLEKVRGAEAANKLKGLIEKTAASGKFELSAKGLTGTGLSEVDVVAALAKKLGKSTAQIKAELAAGKIAATDGVAAIQDALTKQLGSDAGGFETAADGVSKIYEKFTRLFEDVDVSPLLDALKEVSGWFDSSTVAGDAMKFMITTVFTELFAIVKELLPYAKMGFLELVIVALKIYIAFKPIVAQVQALGTQLGITGDTGDTFGVVLKGLIDLMGLFLVGFVVGLQIPIFLVSTIITTFQALWEIIKFVGEGIGAVFSAAWDALVSIFSPGNGSSVAMSLIEGMISGLTGGGGGVTKALMDLGSNALAGVKDVLGIHSPSTAMAEVADNTVDGFTGQVAARSNDAQDALASVVAAPSAESGGSGGSGGGGGASVVIEAGAIVIQSSTGNAQEIAEAVEAKLAEFFESIGMQLGGAGPTADPA